MSKRVSIEQSKLFYNSDAWRNCREMILARDLGLCRICTTPVNPVPADTVHHIKHLRDFWELRFNPENLISVCASCHNKLHPEKWRKKSRKVNSRIKVIETKNPEIF
jgi:5-methylcytosine-specific restriction enzyme A